MPKYVWLLADTLDFGGIQRKVDVMAMLGVPYGDAVNRAETMARTQAHTLAASIEQQGGPRGLEDKKIIALVAYLQRLGTDIKAAPPATEGGSGVPIAASQTAKPITVAHVGGH
jgi:cytochrome c oxidase cbb3-type subunit I/II